MNLSPFFRALRKGFVNSRQQQQLRRRKTALEQWTGLVGCVERLEDKTLLSSVGADDGVSTEDVVAPLAAEVSSIEGINFNEDGINNAGMFNTPPNASGAVGGSHVVSVVNSSIEWHTKAGFQQNSESLQSFFAPLTPVGDPIGAKVLFDQFQNRFVVVAFEQTDTDDGAAENTSRILLAVSDNGDPNGTWFFDEIDALSNFTNITTDTDADHWAARPGIGVDGQALYITANMFTFGADEFGGVRLWIVDKFDFFFSGTATNTQHDPYENAGVAVTSSGAPMTTAPAHVYDNFGGFDGTYLVAYSGLQQNSVEQLQVTRVQNPLFTPSFSVQTLNVGDIEFSTSTLQDSSQDSIGGAIDTGDRSVNNAVWRDGSLYTAANILPNSGADFFDTTAHWWKLNANGSSQTSLVAQGNVGGEDLGSGTFTYNPGVAVDSFGNIGVSFNASGFNLDPGAYFAGIQFNQLGFPTVTTEIAAGLDGYVRTLGSGSNSIGQFSTAAVDPVDDTFWTYNQYAQTRGNPISGETGRWGTRWSNLTILNDPTPTPLAFARLNPLGSGILGSQNNSGFLFSDSDVLNFSLTVDAGETVAAVLNPLDATAQMNIEIVELGLIFTGGPGQDVVIPATTLAQAGTYTLRVTTDSATQFKLDVIRNATIEAIVGNSDNGNELDISNSLMQLGAGRYAVVGIAPRFVVYEERFDDGTSGFQFNNNTEIGNGWHISNGRSTDGDPFHSPPGSLYFGSNETPDGFGSYFQDAFDDLSGEAFSPIVTLPDTQNLILNFNTLIDTTADFLFQDDNGNLVQEVLSIDVFDGNQRTTVASTSFNFNGPQLPGSTGGSIFGGGSAFWASLEYDLSQFAGQDIQLIFNFQSPGIDSFGQDLRQSLEGWYVDDIVIEGDFILDRDEYEIDLTGRAGETIDIILAGQDGADFSGELLQLLRPNGTVAATAQATPLGEDPSNYDLAILDFVVPADGIYTLRLTVDGAGGEYAIVVTDSASFEFETVLPGDPIATYRNLDANGKAIGYTGAIGTPGFPTEQDVRPGVDPDAPPPTVVTESEPNNTLQTADLLPLGFDAGENARVNISGAFTVDNGPITAIFTSENNGSIPLATETNVQLGRTVAAESTIGDGPFGNTTGDFDVFAIRNVSAFETISADVLTSRIGSNFDSTVAIYDAAGNLLTFNDDIVLNGQGLLDSSVSFVAQEDGDYFVVVAGFGSGQLDDPFDAGSGQGRGDVGTYRVNISRNTGIDFYEVQLNAGDVFGATVNGAGTRLSLRDDQGFELIGSGQDLSSIYPPDSPLPGGGNATVGWVVAETGTYYLAVTGAPEATGAYQVRTELYRPFLESQPTGEHQILFLDFDGEGLDTSIFGSGGFSNLSGLSSFLPRWGLTPQQENAVIDSIIATVEENLRADILANGNNPDFALTILNSRDHADPFGQPNVSRVIVGGTINELGIATIGIAESIDPGNFDTTESAVVLLDLLSAAPSDPNSLNQFQIAQGSSKVDLVGVGVGNIVSHEAAHIFGAFHTDQFNDAGQIIDQGGNLPGIVGVGPDGIFGTADDVDVDLGSDTFVSNEGFSGFQDSLNIVAFGLTTGAGGLAGDVYEITLGQDDVLILETTTPLDGLSLPGNSLNPMVNVIGIDGETVIATDSNSAADGKNARLFFRAATAGTYRIQVLAEAGFGEYGLQTRLLTPGEVIAIDDGVFNTNEDTPLNLTSGDLLGNDFNFAPGGVVGYSQPEPGRGTLVENPDGSFTFTPADDFNGTATFTYTISPDGEMKLISGDADPDDSFGRAVAIDGNLMAIGALTDDQAGTDNGAVYLFRRSGNNWIQEQKLVSSTPSLGGGDRFGFSVALDGDFLVVGSVRDSGAGANAGAAFVYRRVSPGNWVQESKLVGSDTNAGDFMGVSVDIDGGNVVVGAFRDNVGASDSGSAYVFVRSTPGGVPTWTQQAKIAANDGDAADRFGRSVAIQGSTILVGAHLDDEGGVDAGAAYIFTRFASFWTEQAKLIAADASAGDMFGVSLDLSGTTALIGSPGRDAGPTLDQGAAYVFTGAGNSWTQQTLLLGSDSRAGDGFGQAVSLDGNTAVIGSPGYDGPLSGAGAAYLFDRDSGLWAERGIYRANQTDANDMHGFAVAISGGDVLVGSPDDDINDNGTQNGAGAAFVYSTNVSTALVTVNVVPQPDAPDIDPQMFTIDENTPRNVFVGQVVASDPDAGQTVSFAIVGGNIGNAFKIDAATGIITVNSSPALDFETTPVFNLTVRATDNDNPALSSTAIVTISLNDINENPATIGDFVFRDINANGIRDLGEFGVAGVTVRLLSPGADGLSGTADDQFLAQVTTNKFGVYKFNAIPPGQYFVQFIAPPGQFFTAPDQGADDTIDSDANPANGRTQIITLLGGSDNLDIDAGLLDPFTAGVGDIVFRDVNGNGLRDNGERGVGQVRVELFSTGIDRQFGGGDDLLLVATTTNKFGAYSFNNLPENRYYLRFVLPTGETFTTPFAGNYKTDSNVNPATGFTNTFDLTVGQFDGTIDAGVTDPGTAVIGDQTWLDTTPGGYRANGEPGVSGVQVNLFNAGTDRKAGTGDDFFVATDITDGNGNYEFAGLKEGFYYVSFSTPPGLAFTLKDAVSNDSRDSDVNPGTGQTDVFLLRARERKTSIDAGYIVPPPVVAPQTSSTPAPTIGSSSFDGLTPTSDIVGNGQPTPTSDDADDTATVTTETEDDEDSLLAALDSVLTMPESLFDE